MPRRHSAPGDTVDCTTVSGRDCAEVFTTAGTWLADPAQADLQVWGAELDQPRRRDAESDTNTYLDLFYTRSGDEAHSIQEQVE